MELNEYYQDEKVLKEILSSVDNPSFRMWKAQKLNGSFVNNTKKINTVKKLKELIGKDTSKLYVSVSQFLNPERIYGKRIKNSVWKEADNLMLQSDMLFDLDHDDLSIAHKDGKKIIEFMKNETEYKLHNIRYSGNKGFHLLYRPVNAICSSDYKSNYKPLLDSREKLVARLPSLVTIDNIHKKIICDLFRVQAAIGSVKAKTGYKVQLISLEDFMNKTTEQILQSLARPTRPMTDSSSLMYSIPDERTRVSSRFYYTMITNKVPNIEDRYVPVLKYAKDKNVDKIIRTVQEKYNLGTLYKIVYLDIQMYISLKVVDFGKLVKILKASKCANLNSTVYYQETFIPYGDILFYDGTEALPSAKLVEVIKSKTTGQYSKSHTNLLRDVFNAEDLPDKYFIGEPVNKIALASEVY